MRQIGYALTALSLLGCLSGCGAAPSGEVPEEALGSVEEALDASCTASIDHLGHYGESGGSLFVYAHALVSCSDGAPVEHRFVVQNPKGKVTSGAWSQWSSDPLELPAGWPEGTYTVTVETRRVGETVVAAKASRKVVVGRTCTWVDVRTQPWSEAPLGTTVVVEPSLWCTDLPHEWRLTVKKPGGGSVNYPWQQGPSLSWDTTGLNAGVATLTVSARNVGNTAIDVTASRTFTVGHVCQAATLTSSGTGNSRTLTGTATCLNDGSPVYRYSVTAPDGTVSRLRDFDPSPDFVWDTTDLDGSYTVKVEVRAGQSPEQLPTSKSLKVPVGNPCTSVTLPDLWGTSYVRQSGLSVTATAPCSNAEFHFQRRVPSTTTWTTVCPYSSSPTCDLDIANQPVGDYVVRVLVRKVGSIASHDAASAQRELVVTDGVPLLRTFFTGFTFSPTALSVDGRWVLATHHRWSRSSGFSALDRPDDAPTHLWSGGANDFSDNGSVIVGYDITSDGQREMPTRGSAGAMGWLINDFVSRAHSTATSSNGSVVVGQISGVGEQQAFRWTSAGLVRLGDLPGGHLYSGATDVSGDGKIVVGYATSATGNQAFRWTAATGMVGLGTFAGDTVSNALGISRNGQVIIGQGGPGNHALRWTAAGGWTELGNVDGYLGTLPAALSTDGSVIVGTLAHGWSPAAFIWTSNHGTRVLADVLAEQGVDVSGWSLQGAVDISGDGKTIVGIGNAPGVGGPIGWLLTLP